MIFINTEKLTLQDVIGRDVYSQVLEAFKQEGYANLRVEGDGSISGERRVVRGLPYTDYLKNIKINISNKGVEITAECTKSDLNTGSII